MRIELAFTSSCVGSLPICAGDTITWDKRTKRKKNNWVAAENNWIFILFTVTSDVSWNLKGPRTHYGKIVDVREILAGFMRQENFYFLQKRIWMMHSSLSSCFDEIGVPMKNSIIQPQKKERKRGGFWLLKFHFLFQSHFQCLWKYWN